jgi:hypothetical protein
MRNGLTYNFVLTIIEGSKDREQKTALEDLYLKSKQQFFAKS